MASKPVFHYWQGLGTDEEALIEILCSRSNAEIQALRAAYERCQWGRSASVRKPPDKTKTLLEKTKNVFFSVFKKSVEKDIEGDTSGYFRRLLLAELRVSPNYPHNSNWQMNFEETLLVSMTFPWPFRDLSQLHSLRHKPSISEKNSSSKSLPP
jgi:Annexin